MKKFKDWLKKHEKIINTILDILITLFVFLAGILIGYDYSKREHVNAEEYNPSPPFEYHYRLPIYFTNIICKGAFGDYSLPIQNNFYSSEDNDVFPFITEIFSPDVYFTLSQTYDFGGYFDNYPIFLSSISVSSGGIRSFTLIAEDFWFSPDYLFVFDLSVNGEPISFDGHYIINYMDIDFTDNVVSFDENSSVHDIASLINSNISDTTPIFYIRRLSISVQLNNTSDFNLSFEFNGFDNDWYSQIVADGVGYSNKTYTETRVNWLGSIIDSVNSALQIQLIPSYSTVGGVTIPAFTLGNVLAFVIIIPLIIAVLKLWLGG